MQLLFFGLILYIPISGIPYIYSSLTGKTIERGIQTNFFLTILRDGLILLTFLLFFTRLNFITFSYFFKKNLYPIMLFLFFFISYSSLYSLFRNGLFTFLSGQKIIEFICISYASYHVQKMEKKCLFKYEKSLSIIFYIEFIICVLQTFLMTSYEGKTFFGSRVIGSFNNPNTIGAFFSFSFMFFVFFSEKRNSFIFLKSLLSIVAVLMSGSRTAIILIAIFSFLFLFEKQKNKGSKFILASLLPITLISLTHILPSLSGRMGSVTPLTEDPRFRIIKTIFNESSFLNSIFGLGIGVGSNTLIGLANTFPQELTFDSNHLQITDSTFTSLFVQFGVLGLFLYLILFFILFLMLKTKGRLIFIFTMTLGISNIWFEMYPINLLLSILIGFSLGDLANQIDSKCLKSDQNDASNSQIMIESSL